MSKVRKSLAGGKQLKVFYAEWNIFEDDDEQEYDGTNNDDDEQEEREDNDYTLKTTMTMSITTALWKTTIKI